tara:strand:- start:263 stop:508 length:246 start_codon:yes stop_codon:yes gene_type:complete
MPSQKKDDDSLDCLSYDSDDNLYIKTEEFNILNDDWYDTMKIHFEEIYQILIEYRDEYPMLEEITFSKLVKFIASNSTRRL